MLINEIRRLPTRLVRAIALWRFPRSACVRDVFRRAVALSSIIHDALRDVHRQTVRRVAQESTPELFLFSFLQLR